MRFRPANISLINRRHLLPRLLLTLSSIEENDQRTLTGHYISGKNCRVYRHNFVNERIALYAVIDNQFKFGPWWQRPQAR